jgi:hypothetical protein
MTAVTRSGATASISEDASAGRLARALGLPRRWLTPRRRLDARWLRGHRRLDGFDPDGPRRPVQRCENPTRRWRNRIRCRRRLHGHPPAIVPTASSGSSRIPPDLCYLSRSSFADRGSRLMRASSRRAAVRSGIGSASSSATGNRLAVYRLAVPARWRANRRSRSTVQPVYRELSLQRSRYTQASGIPIELRRRSGGPCAWATLDGHGPRAPPGAAPGRAGRVAMFG